MNGKREYDLTWRMIMGDFDPGQPRDENGRWTDGGAAHKEAQLEIIQKYNPKDYDINPNATWVESVDDIMTWEEAMYNGDYAEDNVAPDFTWEDAQKAAKEGYVTVYSSYPIKQGIFVSPSKMIAESYSGNGKVYSKKMRLEDVAWIDTSEGQIAEV